MQVGALPGTAITPIEAAAHHMQGGRVAQARAIYLDLLRRDAGDAEALNGLAAQALAAGRIDEAIKLLGPAVDRDPRNPALFANLGRAHHGQGRFDEAIVCYDRAIALAPDQIEPQLNRAAALAAVGRRPEALDALEALARAHPRAAAAHYNLACLHLEAGESALAEGCLRTSLEHDAQQPAAWNNLALLVGRRGDGEGALAAFDQALLLDPGNAQFLCNLATQLADLGRFDEAAARAREAMALAPRAPMPPMVLGRGLLLAGRTGDALRHLADAARLAPDSALPLLELAWAFRTLREPARATAAIERAVALPSREAPALALLARADLLLATGRHAEGWPAWLAAGRAAGRAIPEIGPDGWRGATLRLIGAADDAVTLMWLRLAPDLATRGVTVELACHELLAPLAARAPGISRVVVDDTSHGAAPIVRVAIEDLPALLEAEPSASAGPPFLSADPEQAARWRNALAAWPGPRIGLSWATRAPGATLSDLLPAFAGRPGTLVSLEAGPAAAQLAATRGIVEAGARFEDYGDIAAAIAAVDLVVAIDSPIAHLAGALGKPVVLLLDAAVHWRWGLEGEKSPWYPSMTLLRRAAGGWAPVVERLADEIGRRMPASVGEVPG